MGFKDHLEEKKWIALLYIEIMKKMEFLISNFYVVFEGSEVSLELQFWKWPSIILLEFSMGTNCAPFSWPFCIFLIWQKFQKARREEEISQLDIKYIDDVLAFNNIHFHSYVDSMYPIEFEIRDATVIHTSFIFGCFTEHLR